MTLFENWIQWNRRKIFQKHNELQNATNNKTITTFTFFV